MKMKTKTRNHGWYLLWGVLALVSFCFLSCKDDDKSEENNNLLIRLSQCLFRFYSQRGWYGDTARGLWRQFRERCV